MHQIQLVMLSGFLGAGKTTTMINTAQILKNSGKVVAIVTNDQGKELIDTELARLNELDTEEITGGCFCCRFDELYSTLDALARDKQPDIILCEAVGSCTDLTATVILPLQRYYSQAFSPVPLTTVVDPARIIAELNNNDIQFSQSVSYIFEKQLAEASIIALNKMDQFNEEEYTEVYHYLSKRYPEAVIQPISALNHINLDHLISLWDTTSKSNNKVLNINYDLYAEGEAQLAWMNILGDLQHRSNQAFDPQVWINKLMTELNEHFLREKMAVAHLKVHLTSEHGYAKASIVQTGDAPGFQVEHAALADHYRVVINIRIESSPGLLDISVADALASVNEDMQLDWQESYHECFSPLPPQPTHRLESMV